MAVELKAFFEALARRLSKENHLSEVTYALCQSDEVFKQFFLDFFFGNGTIDVYRDKVEITREQSFNNGRPDFTIRVGNREVYLVEVKIWDDKHHFADYRKILEDEYDSQKEAVGHLGYISNYIINKENLSENDRDAYEIICQDGSTVKTWKDFASRLEAYQAFNDPVIKGYLNYIRSVCPFDDFELPENSIVSLSDFKEIAHFIHGLEEKIKSMEDKGVYYYDSSEKFLPTYYMGQCFELRNYEDGKSAWGWVGINYTKTGAVVFVDFENKSEQGELVCRHFKNLSWDEELRFYLKDTSIKYDAFFEMVIDYVRAKGEKQYPQSACPTADDAARFESLLAMKSFPWLLDRYFLALSRKALDEISNESGTIWSLSSSDTEHDDSESQDEYCGRYYTLNRDNEKYIEFWIGINFDKKTKHPKTQDVFSKQPYSEHPEILFDISKDDYGRIKAEGDSKTEWYELNEWRVVKIINLENNGRFCDLVNAVLSVLENLIKNKRF